MLENNKFLSCGRFYAKTAFFETVIFDTLSLSCGKNILSCPYASIQARDFLFQKGEKREGCHAVWNIFSRYAYFGSKRRNNWPIDIATITVYLSLKKKKKRKEIAREMKRRRFPYFLLIISRTIFFAVSFSRPLFMP